MTTDEKMAAHRREAQERSGFDFDEFIAAGRTAVPPDCRSYVKPAASTNTGATSYRLERLEARLDWLVQQVAELSGEIRYLMEKAGGNK